VMSSGRGQKKSEINPMEQRPPSHVSHVSQVARCGAKTRLGHPCRRPPVQGRKRCRLHGGLSPGAPRGGRNGNYTNGEWTAEAIEQRRWLRSLVLTFAKKGTVHE
jgi:glucans biosynthesis protein